LHCAAGDEEFSKLLNLLVKYCRAGEEEFSELLNLLVKYV
jgi:hypothetical protein